MFVSGNSWTDENEYDSYMIYALTHASWVVHNHICTGCITKWNCNRPISQWEHELHSGNISCGVTRNINSLLFKRNKHVKSWLSWLGLLCSQLFNYHHFTLTTHSIVSGTALNLITELFDPLIIVRLPGQLPLTSLCLDYFSRTPVRIAFALSSPRTKQPF